MNAAANAVDTLQKNGVIAAREKELQAERREANWLKKHREGSPEIPRYDHRMFGKFEFTVIYDLLSDMHEELLITSANAMLDG